MCAPDVHAKMTISERRTFRLLRLALAREFGALQQKCLKLPTPPYRNPNVDIKFKHLTRFQIIHATCNLQFQLQIAPIQT